MNQNSKNEFSRLQDVDKIPPRGLQLTISAAPEECAAVARRLELQAVEMLAAELQVTRDADGVSLHVAGHLTAQVTQSCVVTLAPLPVKLREAMSGRFMPAALIPDTLEAGEIDPAMEEIVEPIVQGTIDLGELTVQHLSLALDPYPRAEGAKLVLPPMPPADAKRHKPFTVLADLVKDKKK